VTTPTLSIRDLRISAGFANLLHIDSLDIAPGERVGLIGESGSGKTLTALAVMGLLGDGLAATGSVRLSGLANNVIGASERTLSTVRGRSASMVFQEPTTALNPLMTIGAQVAEVMLQHHTQPNRVAAGEAARALLSRMELPSPDTIARSYPHQLSGGQRQRVVLAMALANSPALLLCDEPTTALDVTVQSQMLALIDNLVRDSGTSLLFVTHDLAVAAMLCDRIVVLRRGEIVEQGPTARVLGDPQHEYTQTLVAASDVGASNGSRRAVPSGPHTSSADSAFTDALLTHAVVDDVVADYVVVADVVVAEAVVADAALADAGLADRAVSNVVPDGETVLIRARALSRMYNGARATLLASPTPGRGLHPVSFDVRPGQSLGIVGESGSGKSTLVRLLAGLDQATSGSVTISGVNLATATSRQARAVRDTVAMVFQDPASSLDPRMTVAQIVAEPLRGISRAERDDRASTILASVGLGTDTLRRYPHQFSGGERQRISIARALVSRPQLLIADEPVSALDVSVRARVLALLDDLVDEYNLTLVLVSHDLAVVRHICDTVLVMSNGVIVEAGPTDEVYNQPRHGYTRALVAATPSLRKVLAR
jgi:peptide/nickel transport system ATP-binding protein